jgi:hypothetical protein
VDGGDVGVDRRIGVGEAGGGGILFVEDGRILSENILHKHDKIEWTRFSWFRTEYREGNMRVHY